MVPQRYRCCPVLQPGHCWTGSQDTRSQAARIMKLAFRRLEFNEDFEDVVPPSATRLWRASARDAIDREL
jgi:hypothetical protein